VEPKKIRAVAGIVVYEFHSSWFFHADSKRISFSLTLLVDTFVTHVSPFDDLFRILESKTIHYQMRFRKDRVSEPISRDARQAGEVRFVTAINR